MQNVQTIGFQNISGQLDMLKFVMFVVNYHAGRGRPAETALKKATMFVGRPEAKKPSYEDEGRTMILPIDKESPKVYACINETGGLTFMLATEY